MNPLRKLGSGPMISGEKILVTGVTGTVGAPVARSLAKDNEVWGLARFTDPEKRAEIEAAGITTLALDIGSGDFSQVPDDFTYVLHLNWMRGGLDRLQEAIRTNIEGPGLLMQHCRTAKATLVMSSMIIYSPSADPEHLFTESDCIGNASYAYNATSPYSKAGLEAVARTCARMFDMKVTIARLNTVFAPGNCYPTMILNSVLNDGPIVAPHENNVHSPIHIDDIVAQIELMLEAASNPAFIVNWGGDEHVSVQEWVRLANEWSGKSAEVKVAPAPGAPIANASDPELRRSITGPCSKDFRTEYRKLFERLSAPAD
jgi:UDP-glucuronate 4-epimerase